MSDGWNASLQGQDQKHGLPPGTGLRTGMAGGMLCYFRRKGWI